jgi:ferredoxin-NADP reductase
LPRAGDSNARYLLIGTGTGVTPYRAMLPQLAQVMAEREVEVVLLFGARTPVELIYGEDFAAFARRHPRLPLRALLQPRAAGVAASSDVRRGYVQERLARIRAGRRARHRLPVRQPEHGRAVFDALKAQGLPVPHIRREKYVSSK